MEKPKLIAHGEALKNGVITEIATKHKVSAARFCIKYVLQCGLVALPKASSREHFRENAAPDFSVSAEDMERLNGVDFRNYGEYSYFPVLSGK